jgi:hypothetical protein
LVGGSCGRRTAYCSCCELVGIAGLSTAGICSGGHDGGDAGARFVKGDQISCLLGNAGRRDGEQLARVDVVDQTEDEGLAGTTGSALCLASGCCVDAGGLGEWLCAAAASRRGATDSARENWRG